MFAGRSAVKLVLGTSRGYRAIKKFTVSMLIHISPAIIFTVMHAICLLLIFELEQGKICNL